MNATHTAGLIHCGAGNGAGSIFANNEGARSRLEQGGPALYPVAMVCNAWNAGEDEANGHRLVTTWNACDGVPSERLGPGSYARLMLTAQAMLDALGGNVPDWLRSETEALGKEVYGEHSEDEPLQTMPWHLFYIEACDDDGTHAFVVSAESESEAKAQELAESSVLEEVGTEDEPGSIEHCHRLGATDADIFERVGLLADA